MYKIRDLRNLDVNLYYLIDSGLKLNGNTVLSGFSQPYTISGVYLIDGGLEPDNKLRLPAVAIEHERTTDFPFQLGLGRQDTRTFRIEIYARSDGERDDLGEMIKNYFYSTKPIYDYNEYFQNGTYVVLGNMDFENISMYPSRLEEFKATRHRMNITLDCNYYISSGASLIS